MGSKSKIIFLLSFLFVSVFSSPAYSEEHRWGASSILNQPGWQVLNSAYFADGDTLVLASDSAPRLASPPMNVPVSKDVLEIILESPADGTGGLGFGLSGGGVKIKYFKLLPGKKIYRIYLGDTVKEGSIQGFVAEFYGGAGKEYRLESIRFFSPTAPELFRVLWDGFWEPETIKVSTINSITTPAFGPLSLMVLLYILIVIITVALAGLRLLGGRPFDRRNFSGALAAAFFIASVALAVRMDYNWVLLRGEESRTLSGKSTSERIRALNGPETGSFLSFIDFVKKSVPEGKTVAPAGLPAGEQTAAMARYYLLPVVTSSRPDYIWVYNEARVYYDPVDSSLKKGGLVVAAPVRPFKAYSANSAVYETIR